MNKLAGSCGEFGSFPPINFLPFGFARKPVESVPPLDLGCLRNALVRVILTPWAIVVGDSAVLRPQAHHLREVRCFGLRASSLVLLIGPSPPYTGRHDG
jgi:hypothetical protein